MGHSEMIQLKATQKLLRTDAYGYSDSSDAPIPEKNVEVGELFQNLAKNSLPEAERQRGAVAAGTHIQVLDKYQAKMMAGVDKTMGTDETVQTVDAMRSSSWNLWTMWRNTYPEQGTRAAIASELLEQMGRTKKDIDSKRPIHVVCDWWSKGYMFLGLLAEFLDNPVAGVLPPGSKLTLWSGNNIGMALAIQFIAPPFAFAGDDSKSAIDVAATTDLQKLHFAAVAGPYLPGKGGGATLRGTFGLPDGNFPDWFVGTAERIHNSVLPWFPTTAAALDGDGFEKVVSIAARPPESVFGNGLGAGYEKRITWLNTVGGQSESPKADEVAIVKELEAAGEPGKTVVYVAFGTDTWIPLLTPDGKSQPYKEFLRDLMNLGEDFVVAVRVAWAPRGTDLSSVELPPGAQKPKELLDSLTKGWKKGKGEGLLSMMKKKPAKIVLYEDYFPQQALFASQKLQQSGLIFVTHCGASSISEAMRAKIPMVTVPAMLEQAVNARQLRSHGVGVDASAAGFRHYILFENGARFPEKLVLPGSFLSIEKAVEVATANAQEMRGKTDQFVKAMGERSVTPKQLADLLATPSSH